MVSKDISSKRTTNVQETYIWCTEPISGANSLAQQGYCSYNPYIHELHVSYETSTKTTSPIEGLFLTNGRELRKDELVYIDGETYANPFWSMFDLWYSQTDDTAITESIEEFEDEGLLEDFLAFSKSEGMHQEVIDFNVRKYINNEQLVPLPEVMGYTPFEYPEPDISEEVRRQIHENESFYKRREKETY